MVVHDVSEVIGGKTTTRLTRLQEDDVVTIVVLFDRPTDGVVVRRSYPVETGGSEPDDAREALCEARGYIRLRERAARGPLAVVPGWDLRRTLPLGRCRQLLASAEARVRQTRFQQLTDVR